MAEEASSSKQIISMEREYKEWGSKVTFGVLAGMLYGGSKEALSSTHYGEVLTPMQEGKDLKTKRFMWRELVEQRVIRITRGTVLGGAKLGSFTAIFCGIQGWLAVERNVHDTLNVVAAGSGTAAAFGLTGTNAKFFPCSIVTLFFASRQRNVFRFSMLLSHKIEDQFGVWHEHEEYLDFKSVAT